MIEREPGASLFLRTKHDEDIDRLFWCNSKVCIWWVGMRREENVGLVEVIMHGEYRSNR